MDLAAGIEEGGLESNSIFSLFSISVHVTDEGFAHLKEVGGVLCSARKKGVEKKIIFINLTRSFIFQVLAAIFSYLRYIQAAGPSERIFNELKNVEENAFRFSQERDPIDNVEDLVISLKDYPSEHILSGDYLYFDYDPVAIQGIIDELNKPNFNIMITSTHLFEEDMKYDLKEKWFGTEHCERDMPAEWTEMWKSVKPYPELALPEPNPYIADDFSISYQPGAVVPKFPVQLIDTDCCELWHRQDDKFLLPIAHYYFYFMSPNAMWSAEKYEYTFSRPMPDAS